VLPEYRSIELGVYEVARGTFLMRGACDTLLIASFNLCRLSNH